MNISVSNNISEEFKKKEIMKQFHILMQKPLVYLYLLSVLKMMWFKLKDVHDAQICRP